MSADDLNLYLESEEFQAECEKNFNEYDTDGSGFLDKKELRKCLEDLASAFPVDGASSFSVTDDDVEEAMKDLDTNHDDKISLDEFGVLAKMIFSALIAGFAEALAGDQ